MAPKPVSIKKLAKRNPVADWKDVRSGLEDYLRAIGLGSDSMQRIIRDALIGAATAAPSDSRSPLEIAFEFARNHPHVRALLRPACWHHTAPQLAVRTMVPEPASRRANVEARSAESFIARLVNAFQALAK